MGTNVSGRGYGARSCVWCVAATDKTKKKKENVKESCIFICYIANNVLVIINAKILTCEVLALTRG